MRRMLAILGLGIAAICYYSVLFLLIGFTAAVAIPALFTLLFILLCVVAFVVFLDRPDAEQYFYGLPGSYIAMFGLLIQAILGIVLALLHVALIPVLIIELILFGLLGSIECYVLYAGLRARDLQERYDEDISTMRRLRAQAEQLWRVAPDYTWQRRIKETLEVISYANPVRTDYAQDLEEAVSEALHEMNRAMRADDEEAFAAAQRRIRNILSD